VVGQRRREENVEAFDRGDDLDLSLFETRRHDADDAGLNRHCALDRAVTLPVDGRTARQGDQDGGVRTNIRRKDIGVEAPMFDQQIRRF